MRSTLTVTFAKAHGLKSESRAHIIEHFKALKAEGNKLILWTCREGQAMRDAINWCMKQGLHFDAYNSNLPELNALYGNDSRKIGADFYCDDKNYWLMPGGFTNESNSIFGQGRGGEKQARQTWSNGFLCVKIFKVLKMSYGDYVKQTAKQLFGWDGKKRRGGAQTSPMVGDGQGQGKASDVFGLKRSCGLQK